MGLAFTAELNAFFGSTRGAYSKVTNDEFNKSQVTFVGAEQDLAESFFGNRLDGHHGSIEAIRASGFDPEFEFRIHPSGAVKRLTVSYKTNRAGELRFYARKDVFKPNPGEYWCIFQRGDEIWLGSFTDWTLAAINDGILQPRPRALILEPEIDSYQDLINLNDPAKVQTTLLRWRRNPNVAATALKNSGYVCEVHPEYPSFFFRGTSRIFVEAHHLIPMSLQDQFGKKSLDQIDNICVINPLSHRMLHHADFGVIESDLNKLIAKRSGLLSRLGLSKYDILEMYNI